MANQIFATNDPLTRKVWSTDTFKEAIGMTYFGKFMGTGGSNMIQVKTDLNKGKGDRVRIPLRGLLTGAGVTGDSTLEGNEEALTLYYDDVTIDQVRHAVRSDGRMSEQRGVIEFRTEAKAALADWNAEMMDKAMINQLTGNTAASGAFTGNNTVSTPTRVIYVDGKTTEAGIASTGASTQFSLEHLDYAIQEAKVKTGSNYRIRPIKVNGQEMYVGFCHPYQVRQLRTGAGSARWQEIQDALLSGGKIVDNPIFTGAIGIYNNIILHETDYVPASPSYSNVLRAVICGAQAASIAFGQETDGRSYDWVEETFDYGNQKGVSTYITMGIKKSVFNSQDYGAIVLPSQSTATI